MAKKKQKNTEDFAAICSSIISGVIGVGIFALVTVFPLIYHNSYLDILETKYGCYWITVVAMLGICLGLGLIMAGIDFMEFGGTNTKRLFSALHPRRWKETFHLADAAVLVFWLASLISTFQSDYFYESFWGNEGRYSGLFLLTLYVAVYFLISRFWKPKWWYVEVFLISGMIMCYVGITDYFQLDVLDFRGVVKPTESTSFTSTVGNINTYTAYVGMVMGVAGALFATEKNPIRILWHYACMLVAIAAIIMGCSDNAYLSLAAFLGLLPLVLFQNREGMKRYLIILASFFSIIKVIDHLNQKYADMVVGLQDSLFKYIVEFKSLSTLIFLLWAAVVLFWIYCAVSGKKHVAADGKERFLAGRVISLAWGAMIVAVVLVTAFVLYDANIAGNVERYAAVRKYVIFDDWWGTSRGYIWKRAMRLYKDFSFKRKLWGYGPDTFGILTTDMIREEMISSKGVIFDNAHNAYIQYLLTIGPIGVIGYVGFLIAAFWRMLRSRDESPYILAALVAALCYVSQSLVNLDLPIATPIMWLLVSMGMAGCLRSAKKTAEDSAAGAPTAKGPTAAEKK